MLRRIHTTDGEPVAESGYVAEGRTVESGQAPAAYRGAINLAQTLNFNGGSIHRPRCLRGKGCGVARVLYHRR